MENIDLQVPEEPLIKLIPAGYGKRLANYLIDFFIYIFIAAIIIALTAPIYPLANKLMNKQPIGLSDQLMVSFLYGLFMAVMEALLKGKSIGKYITGTRAVSEDGMPITSQTAFVRGLIRVIPFPFEQLSAFVFSFDPFSLLAPYPWHDRWSRSIVVDEAKSILPKN